MVIFYFFQRLFTDTEDSWGLICSSSSISFQVLSESNSENDRSA